MEDITRADQIPVLKEETQHATVSERVTSRFYPLPLSPVRSG
ncbi:carboxy-terminal protease [Salmonella enterica subsp. enterica serovar Heidelberg str. 77-1831]|nr:carboxy-terminal protease [Salmonella enterica subsp. enterica serovar Heidelberg str. 77-1831]